MSAQSEEEAAGWRVAAAQGEAQARQRRATLTASATASSPPPQVDAEWLCRQMSRHDLDGVGLALVLDVTGAAASQWMRGHPIPAKRQRQLMDLFGEPLSLREATTQDLVQELFRRLSSYADE